MPHPPHPLNGLRHVCCVLCLPSTQCCTQLAQGKLTPDHLTEEVLSLVSTRLPQQPTSPLSLSMEELGVWGQGETEARPSVEMMRLMHKFSERATYAQRCCNCIITCFKIAVVSYSCFGCVHCTLHPFHHVELSVHLQCQSLWTQINASDMHMLLFAQVQMWCKSVFMHCM